MKSMRWGFKCVGLVLCAWGLAVVQGCGSTCTLQKNGDGTATLKCGEESYVLRPGKDGADGKNGSDGEAGKQGDKGDTGKDGDNCALSINGEQAELKCGSETFKVVSAEKIVNGVCTSKSLGCGLLEVTCGQGAGKVPKIFRVGNNTCKEFLVEELDQDGKLVKKLHGGDANSPGDGLELEKRYRLVIKNDYPPKTPLTQLDLVTFSNVVCSANFECEAAYCDTLKKQHREYDILCRQDADCASVGGDKCEAGVCVIRYKDAGGQALSCTQDSDCRGIAVDDADAAKKCLEVNGQKYCYFKAVHQEAYKNCQAQRGQFEPECVYYPFRVHEEGKAPARCILFRLAGKLIAETSCTKDEECDPTGSCKDAKDPASCRYVCQDNKCHEKRLDLESLGCTQDKECQDKESDRCLKGLCHDELSARRYSRDLPIETTCSWMKYSQSVLLKNEDRTHTQTWNSSYQARLCVSHADCVNQGVASGICSNGGECYEPMTGGATSCTKVEDCLASGARCENSKCYVKKVNMRPKEYEFTGFARFTDNTVQYFRYAWYKQDDIGTCRCPPGQVYNPAAGAKKCE